MKYFFEKPWIPLSELNQSSTTGSELLEGSEDIPSSRYREAIHQVVKVGDVVLDLRVGTGLLSLWALEAGAKLVYGIDLDSSKLSSAVNFLSFNGFKDAFIPINKSSFDVSLHKKVDVVVFDNIGNLGDNGGLQLVLQDVFARLVRIGVRSIPSSIRTYIAPVCAEQAHKCINDRQVSSPSNDTNLDSFLKAKNLSSAFNLYYDIILPRNSYLSSPQLVKEYNGLWNQRSIYNKKFDFKVEKKTMLTGICAYVVAQLSENLKIDLSDGKLIQSSNRNNWRQALFPVALPIQTKPGDIVQVSYSRSDPTEGWVFEQIYRWRGQVVRDNEEIGSFDQCMDEETAKDSKLL